MNQALNFCAHFQFSIVFGGHLTEYEWYTAVPCSSTTQQVITITIKELNAEEIITHIVSPKWCFSERYKNSYYHQLYFSCLPLNRLPYLAN